MRKLRSVLTEYKAVLFSFVLSGIIFSALLAQIGIFPFGPLTLLISDMNSIYSDFLSEYQRVLQGNGNWLYSFHAGIGLNLLAIFFFYLPSPFNLLSGLFPQKNLLDAVTLITVLKIACAGAAFSLYLIKRFRGSKNTTLAVTFGVLYALLAYNISYSFNLIWIDGVILLPLVFLAIDGLISDNRWLPCVFVYAILFLSNFYIGYMVGMFSALYFLMRLCIQRPNTISQSLRKMIWFAGTVLLAAGLNAALLLPTAAVLKDNMGLFGQEAPLFRSLFPAADLLLKSFPLTFDGYKDSLPHIYCGLITLFGVPLYFHSKQIRTEEKAGAAALLVILTLSFMLAPLDFFWHAFDHPSWFPYRYAFLLPFWLLLLAYQGLITSTEKRNPVLIGAAAILTGYLLWTQKISSEKLSDSVLYLNILYLWTVAYFLSDQFRGKKSILAVILIFCSFEAALNARDILKRYAPDYVRRADYVAFRDHYLARVNEAAPTNGAFYRMEKDAIRTYNDPLMLGYPGIANFSSVASLSQSRFLKKLGFDCYATWCTYQGRTLVSDAFLGIRYLLTDKNMAGYQPYADGILHNSSAFPPAFWVSAPFASFPDLSADDPIALQEAILYAISPTEQPYFSQIKLNPTKLLNLEKGNADSEHPVYSRLDLNQPASIIYQTAVPANGTGTLFIPFVSLNYDVWINDAQIFGHHQNYTPYLVDLSSYNLNDLLTIRIDLVNQPEVEDSLSLYTLDLQRFSQLAGKIQDESPKINFDGKTVFKFDLPEPHPGGNLLTSIPYDAGWQAQADGKPLALVRVMDSLIGLEIPAGTTQISLKFIPVGFKTGVTISVLSVIILILGILIDNLANRRKQVKTRTKLHNPGY